MSHALTLIVTRDVEARYRGFLRSAMLEVVAGIYVSTQLNVDARDRLFLVLENWYKDSMRGSIVMIWRDKDESSDIGLHQLGTTRKEICDVDGFLLTRIKK